jgi:2',3'-cyclic-nucleotide 2'-phosphodiesterase (5'-nucleotidase family)
MEYQNVGDLEGFSVLGFQDTIHRLSAELATLRGHADFTVLLSSALDNDVNLAIADRVPGLDAILGAGGQYRSIVERRNGTLIVSPSWSGKAVGVMDAQLDSKGKGSLKAALPIDVTSELFRPDVSLRDMMRTFWNEQIEKSGDNHVVGYIRVAGGIPLSADHPILLPNPYWSYFDSPILSFVAEALRTEYANWEASETGAKVGSIDMAFVNTGSIEAGLPFGFVTDETLQHCFPYNNKIVKVTLTPAQVRSLLASPGMFDHGILGVSGLEYTWDYRGRNSRADSLVAVGPDGRRSPLTKNLYTVVMPDFMATGGDGYLSDATFAAIRQRVSAMHAEQDSHVPSIIELMRRHLYRRSPIDGVPPIRARFLR